MLRGLRVFLRVFVALIFGGLAAFAASNSASAETRTLKIYYVHTGERAEITFKRNGRYLQDGLNKLNYALRDWRRNQPTKMDPRLMDTIWEVYQKTGSREYIHVVCGYRSASTNSMLRKRSKGVAEKSQHVKGKAMDFYIPGVSLKKLRYLGLQLQAGGVGYYPRSGSPFVHLDVGNVRHWPKMSRSELMAVFPNGKTLHVPSDGRPLAGYEVAMASYKSRLKAGSSAKFDSSAKSGSGGRSLLAVLFGGGGADEEEDTSPDEEVAIAAAKVKPVKAAKAQETLVSAAPPEKPGAPKPEKEILVAALPQRTSPAPLAIARPSQDLDSAAPVETEALAFAVPVPARKPRTNPVLSEPTAEAALSARMAPDEKIVAKKPDSAAMVQMASLDPKEEAEAIRSAFGEQGPAAARAAEAQADEPFFVGAVPVPSSKPDQDGEPFMVASIAVPTPRPVISSDAAAEPAIASAAPVEAAAVEVAMAEPEAKPVRDDLRKIIADQGGIDPETVADTGVKTTDKEPKPKAGEGRKARKLMVVPVTKDVGKFALSKEPVTGNGKEVVALTYGQESVWNAPTEVYVAGFSTDAPQDVNKFSGKAVNFLKVAKFKKAK